MNKKVLIPVLLSGLLFASLSFRKASRFVIADDVINFDVDAIQALSHKDGMTVNTVNSDILEYWNSDVTDIDNLRNLYENNDEIVSFFDNSYDHEYIRELYAKWDDFKPVNNVLTWKSNVRANSYDIVISLDAELTQAMYEEKGLTDTSYTMENPFANTHYYWQITAHTDNEDVKSQIFDFYTADNKRTVNIPTISNTRDIGGFTGRFGEMKHGLIYRSGRLDDSNEEAQAALTQLDIQTDLDLRNNGEGAKNPAHLPHYYLRTLQSYFNDLREENRAATIEAVRIFADPDNYPVIFHCAIGRDRTGTLAIILQALCGASKEYIIHDYYTSMWSVTGCYQKTVEQLNLNLLNDVFTELETLGNGSIITGAENFLKQRDNSDTGLTDAEIQVIRDIWSGKTETAHGQKTFKSSENYEGKAYVKVEAIGHKDVAMMVTKGTTVSAPYELDNDLAWFSNGEAFSFANPINETTFIYADYSSQYVVTIHFIGIAKQDEILRANYGDVISLNEYERNGFDMLAISDEGREISTLTVTRDCYINIIYMKK